MFKYLKNKIFLTITVLVFLNINFAYSFPLKNIITNEDGIKIYEYDLRGDEYDENYNLIISDDTDHIENKYLIDGNNEINYNSRVIGYSIDMYSVLESYLEELSSVISDEEKELILKYLPDLMYDKIYFDVDYNEVSVADMKKIYDALIKIYDVVKVTATPLIEYEHLGMNRYIYGYNIDFLRANIKSLKNALNRKEIVKIDKNKLKSAKHNILLDELYYYDKNNGERINTRYEIIKVSELIDDTYYNVVLKPIMNTDFSADDIIYDLNENDIVKYIFRNREKGYLFKSRNIIETDATDDGYTEFVFLDLNENKEVIFIDGNWIDFKDDVVFAIKVYKNAVCLTLKEFLINNYVAKDRLEDNFYDNLKLEDNLFCDIDKKGLYVTTFDFDEKGYVKTLIDIRGQYE